ncbi:HAD-IA family hydrolase [Aliidiomarina haloalkalitolerans]|uniref:Phosphoesterase n=1 Tax=Aliidiomarina haloalkalitolerans TaxID=859059 RepID=A0A432VRB9_9GAMM|nr:HAD-IA family hydrolase [Aliidiomarina haloalkalitolerans]RUO18831.1 phosphoesterase [Aliidiomarina haloalkalitolerans]
MWQFYRRLQPFSVISFDLDDTLYNNKPIMTHAEQHIAEYIGQRVPAVSHMNAADWRQLREQVAGRNRELASDMTALREAAVIDGLRQFGTEPTQALVDDIMEEFLNVRNQVTIDEHVHQLLARLATQYALVAVSNGNADIQRIGLGQYFQAAWRPGQGLRGKPFTDMFAAVHDRFSLQRPSQILHIGDHPVSDVEGALGFGAQVVWYSPTDAAADTKQTTRLPTARIEDLQALADLLR